MGNPADGLKSAQAGISGLRSSWLKACHGKDFATEGPFRCTPVNKQIPSYLKLVTDSITEPPAAQAEDLASIHEVCRAFEQATGWPLETSIGSIPSAKSNLMWSAPVNPGVGASPRHIRILSTETSSKENNRTPLPVASELAGAVGKLWGELLAARRALWQREAELATGVPLTLSDEESPQLRERLEAVLRGGAEAVGCQAAALYLLDPATTELKLRSSWGLPYQRFTAPARPLRGAMADLEALLGHAVVLTDDELHGYWKVPEENFASCVCVPVSSATMPLGTLWIFSRNPRDFSDAETNIVEVVAGRLASDLERQVLAYEALATRDQTKQMRSAQQSQDAQLPSTVPMIEGWEIAANAHHCGPIGGTFYDWFSVNNDGLAIVAGDATQSGVGGALISSALRAAARAQAPDCQTPHRLLEKANSILWTGSAGNDCAGLFQAILRAHGEYCEFAASGPVRVLRVGPNGSETVTELSPAVGLNEEMRFRDIRADVAHGEVLLVYGTTFLADQGPAVLAALDERLSASLETCLDLSARRLAGIAGQILQGAAGAEHADRVLVVIKRRRR